MEIALALAAALLFALGIVLQGEVASEASEEESRSASFLVALARKPRWLAGIASDVLGFIAQAGALAVGSLVVVQPLLATSVVFALPLGALLAHRPVAVREIAAALAVTVGLGAFLVLANPQGGVDNANAVEWVGSFVVCGGLAAVLLLAGRGRSPVNRAALIGMAAGILFALTAALTKTMVDQLGDGVLTVFENWQVYALAVTGWAAMTASQRSLQAGALAPAVATQMALNPITSVALGVLAFEEKIHETTAMAVVSMLAFAVMIAGLVTLAVLVQQD